MFPPKPAAPPPSHLPGWQGTWMKSLNPSSCIPSGAPKFASAAIPSAAGEKCSFGFQNFASSKALPFFGGRLRCSCHRRSVWCWGLLLFRCFAGDFVLVQAHQACEKIGLEEEQQHSLPKERLCLRPKPLTLKYITSSSTSPHDYGVLTPITNPNKKKTVKRGLSNYLLNG